jgi:uncharacterized lipoprotein YajG
MLQRKLTAVLTVVLVASLVFLAGCSTDSSSVGNSDVSPQIGPGGTTNSIEGAR